jgi:2-haloacid dehalogenase
MMNYKLILFDADGTLFDFDKAEMNAFKTTIQRFGITGDIDSLHQVYEKINKAIWMDFQNKKITSTKLRIERFKSFFEKMEIDLSAEEVSPVYLYNLSKGIDLLPGAEEIAKYYHEKCILTLATNGLSDVQNPRFAASSIAEYFQHIFISEEIGYPKPDKEYFEHIFSLLPYQESTIIIGDSLSSDIAGGINAGIDTCWFNPERLINETKHKPTYEIRDILELKKIIK